MARKKNTKKRRSGLLGALVLLILLGVMAYKLVEVYGDLSAAKEQEARLHAQVEQKEEENNSLEGWPVTGWGWWRTVSASFRT